MRERAPRTERDVLLQTRDGNLLVYVVTGDKRQLLSCPGLHVTLDAPTDRAQVRELMVEMIREAAQSYIDRERQGQDVLLELIERARLVLAQPYTSRALEFVELQRAPLSSNIISPS